MTTGQTTLTSTSNTSTGTSTVTVLSTALETATSHLQSISETASTAPTDGGKNTQQRTMIAAHLFS